MDEISKLLQIKEYVLEIKFPTTIPHPMDIAQSNN